MSVAPGMMTMTAADCWRIFNMDEAVELLDCMTCKPPTRYPGCQDHCPCGIANRIVDDIVRYQKKQRCIVNDGLKGQRRDAISKCYGNRKK